MPCKPILVVEDDEDIRDKVAQALRVEGYEVLTADDGLTALGLLKSLAPDRLPCCMILDLMMPRMDGKTLMSEIEREHPDFSQIKILVATAKGSAANPGPMPRALARIQKPFDLDELYSAIEQHCGKP